MIKKYLFILLAIVCFASCQTSNKIIKTKVPSRPKGQTHVLGLTTPKLDTVRIGIIGLGMRGISAVE
ncbi:MAG: glycosyl hydrolase, partial [Bacteroidales bacterium]|nr:glycosyl hydrolase [Bacteroidales bacterium]